MLRTWILSTIALAGTGFAIYMSNRTNAPVPVGLPVAAPAEAPFARTLAGAGIIESQNENIAIGVPVPTIVTDILVRVGDRVAAGDPLLKMDDRDLKAQWIVKKAAVISARAKLNRLNSMPRPEELPPARARVEAAQGTLLEARNQLGFAEAALLKFAGSISSEELNKRRQAVTIAVARTAEAEASLKLLEAGAWAPDREVAAAELASAEADVESLQLQIDRMTVRAPVAATVLKINIRKGEFASPSDNPDADPMFVIGDTTTLHVRVDIDEADISRFNPAGKAVLHARGNASLTTELQFVRTEPWVVPKRSLTGDSRERVDTRVMQVIYRFDPAAVAFPAGSLPVGAQADVFIESK